MIKIKKKKTLKVKRKVVVSKKKKVVKKKVKVAAKKKKTKKKAVKKKKATKKKKVAKNKVKVVVKKKVVKKKTKKKVIKKKIAKKKIIKRTVKKKKVVKKRRQQRKKISMDDIYAIINKVQFGKKKIIFATELTDAPIIENNLKDVDLKYDKIEMKTQVVFTLYPNETQYEDEMDSMHFDIMDDEIPDIGQIFG